MSVVSDDFEPLTFVFDDDGLVPEQPDAVPGLQARDRRR